MDLIFRPVGPERALFYRLSFRKNSVDVGMFSREITDWQKKAKVFEVDCAAKMQCCQYQRTKPIH